VMENSNVEIQWRRTVNASTCTAFLGSDQAELEYEEMHAIYPRPPPALN
jgi:hypothetical protein